MAKALEKAKVRLAEKMSKETTSKYPAEFVQSTKLIDATGEGTAELVDRLKKHLNCFGTGDTLVVEQLGEAAAHLASGLSAGAPYTLSLLAMSRAEKLVGAAERRYARNVTEKVIVPLNKWLTENYKAYKDARRKLDKDRAEMDKAAQNAREKGDVRPELRVAEEARTNDHSAQMQVVQKMLDALPRDLEKHKALITTFLELQQKLHAECAVELDKAIKDIAPRVK